MKPSNGSGAKYSIRNRGPALARASIVLVLMFVLVLATGFYLRHDAYARVIVAVPRDTAASFSVTEHAGLTQVATPAGLRIRFNGPRGGDDTEQQIRLVGQAIEDNVAGIVLTPNTPFALNTVVERALSRHIPVVILGAPIDLKPDPNLSFVRPDLDASAVLAAQRIRAIVHDDVDIAIVGVDPSVPGTAALAGAFDRALGPWHGAVLHLAGSQRPGQAEDFLRTALHDHPHIGAVWALNVQSTHGAYNALQALGLASHIPLIATDHAVALLYMLRFGRFDSLIAQDFRGMGEAAAQNILDQRAHHAIVRDRLFAPVLITRDNLDTPAIQHRLLMDWRRAP